MLCGHGQLDRDACVVVDILYSHRGRSYNRGHTFISHNTHNSETCVCVDRYMCSGTHAWIQVHYYVGAHGWTGTSLLVCTVVFICGCMVVFDNRFRHDSIDAQVQWVTHTGITHAGNSVPTHPHVHSVMFTFYKVHTYMGTTS